MPESRKVSLRIALVVIVVTMLFACVVGYVSGVGMTTLVFIPNMYPTLTYYYYPTPIRGLNRTATAVQRTALYLTVEGTDEVTPGPDAMQLLTLTPVE